MKIQPSSGKAVEGDRNPIDPTLFALLEFSKSALVKFLGLFFVARCGLTCHISICRVLSEDSLTAASMSFLFALPGTSRRVTVPSRRVVGMAALTWASLCNGAFYGQTYALVSPVVEFMCKSVCYLHTATVLQYVRKNGTGFVKAHMQFSP